MTTAAVSGFGSLLSWDGVDLDEITSITGPGESRATIDVTSHDSPDSYMEFIAGLGDGGEISFEGNFIKGDTTGQIAMHTDFQAGSAKTWIIKHPAWVSSSAEYPQITGSGICTSFVIGAFPIDGKIALTGTIKVTGKPTLTVS